jgi:hypothetical protein
VAALLTEPFTSKSPALSDAFISSVYVIMLGILGSYALYDWFSQRKSKGSGGHGGSASIEATTKFAKLMQGINIPPKVTF